MSTKFRMRNLKRRRLSKVAVIVASVVAVLAIVGTVAGWHLYKKLTNNTVVAYFSQTLALYPGDQVQILGVPVGNIDQIEPAGDKIKVTLHYQNKYRVPANATASVLNPALVTSRVIQLSPGYTGGPVLENGAVIPIERTQMPVEWDDLRDQMNRNLVQLGPTPQQPKGPFGDLIETSADGLADNGKQINRTLNALSDAVTTLNQSRGDISATVRGLAMFGNTLYQSDQQFVQLNSDLAQFTNAFSNDPDLANVMGDVDNMVNTLRRFLDENADLMVRNVNDLTSLTTALVQPKSLEAQEKSLHVMATMGANLVNIYHPAQGSQVALPVVPNFTNPMNFICSAIQAGSRLGYQESAELCAQYLAPVLDAIKFNYMPFGSNMISTAATLPKHVSYSEERLRPPPGYKDTTVPGIWSRDTLFSHGNHEPGWIVAPGMQGIDVQPFTENMLTPDSLAELMGGPDIEAPTAPPHFGPEPLPGAPNAYDEYNPPAPPWFPPGPQPPPGYQSGPPPAPAGYGAEAGPGQ